MKLKNLKESLWGRRNSNPLLIAHAATKKGEKGGRERMKGGLKSRLSKSGAPERTVSCCFANGEVRG